MQTTFGIWLEPPLPVQQRILTYRKALQSRILSESQGPDNDIGAESAGASDGASNNTNNDDNDHESGRQFDDREAGPFNGSDESVSRIGRSTPELNFQIFSLPPWFFLYGLNPVETAVSTDAGGAADAVGASVPADSNPMPGEADTQLFSTPFWLQNPSRESEPGIFHRDRTAGRFHSPALRNIPSVPDPLSQAVLGDLRLYGIELQLDTGNIPRMDALIHEWKPETAGGWECSKAFLPIFTLYGETSIAGEAPAEPAGVKATADFPRIPKSGLPGLPDIRFQRSTVHLAQLAIEAVQQKAERTSRSIKGWNVPAISMEMLISADLVQRR
ncbi:hypothetical protein [Salinispira pacifica]|uniref:Uncharacterized protein n=1 Tax=Salinispira pacifica TaxID=1307761 RepID=V5WIH4_9SPIO|nr:hypothetical protein [Salinispira pacifica]AHC15622.1 hypothetical protein L21SP2_2261 [Salinispira pacifica]